MSHSSDVSNNAGSRAGSSSVERDLVDGDGTPTMGGSVGGIAVAAAATVSDVELTPRRKTSFATLPNTTTWQQQAISVQKMDDVGKYTTMCGCVLSLFIPCYLALLLDDSQPLEDASKISTIKLKLEEKRRLIEQEKRRIETAWTRQLQTVGKQAFLQAISKVRGALEPRTTRVMVRGFGWQISVVVCVCD